MKDTFKEFCTPDKRILFAFSYSDEISILIKTDLKNARYRLEKLLSLYSSEISVLFIKILYKIIYKQKKFTYLMQEQ